MVNNISIYIGLAISLVSILTTVFFYHRSQKISQISVVFDKNIYSIFTENDNNIDFIRVTGNLSQPSTNKFQYSGFIVNTGDYDVRDEQIIEHLSLTTSGCEILNAESNELDKCVIEYETTNIVFNLKGLFKSKEVISFLITGEAIEPVKMDFLYIPKTTFFNINSRIENTSCELVSEPFDINADPKIWSNSFPSIAPLLFLVIFFQIIYSIIVEPVDSILYNYVDDTNIHIRHKETGTIIVFDLLKRKIESANSLYAIVPYSEEQLNKKETAFDFLLTNEPDLFEIVKINAYVKTYKDHLINLIVKIFMLVFLGGIIIFSSIKVFKKYTNNYSESHNLIRNYRKNFV